MGGQKRETARPTGVCRLAPELLVLRGLRRLEPCLALEQLADVAPALFEERDAFSSSSSAMRTLRITSIRRVAGDCGAVK